MGKSRRGSKSHFWKGGLTPEHTKVRNSAAYKGWRMAILERDNHTCVGCGAINLPLEVHHIKPFKEYPELRLDDNNAQTLCVDCHNKTKEKQTNGVLYEVMVEWGFTFKGRKHSEDTKKRMVERMLGHVPWNKGMVITRKNKPCKHCGNIFKPKKAKNIFCSNRCSAFNRENLKENKIV